MCFFTCVWNPFPSSILTSDSVVKYDKDPVGNAADRIYGLIDNGHHAQDHPFTENLRSAMQTIEEALNCYR